MLVLCGLPSDGTASGREIRYTSPAPDSPISAISGLAIGAGAARCAGAIVPSPLAAAALALSQWPRPAAIGNGGGCFGRPTYQGLSSGSDWWRPRRAVETARSVAGQSSPVRWV